MPRITIEVPAFLTNPKLRAKFEKAIEDIQPGTLCALHITHEEFCLEKLGRGDCNCDAVYTVEKINA